MDGHNSRSQRLGPCHVRCLVNAIQIPSSHGTEIKKNMNDSQLKEIKDLVSSIRIPEKYPLSLQMSGRVVAYRKDSPTLALALLLGYVPEKTSAGKIRERYERMKAEGRFGPID